MRCVLAYWNGAFLECKLFINGCNISIIVYIIYLFEYTYILFYFILFFS